MSDAIQRALELIQGEIQRQCDEVAYLKQIRDCVVVNSMHTLGSTRAEAEAFANGTSKTPFLTALSDHVKGVARASATPTTAQIMADKRVRELVRYVSRMASQDLDAAEADWEGGFRLSVKDARAALAQLKEQKP